MTSNRVIQSRSAFTLVEILVGMAVFGIFATALVTTWTALQSSAVNTTSYAQRQNDQARIFDYIKRDVRRASNVEIYSGATLITATGTFGTELRLTIPDYYSDSREEDNAVGTRAPNTPTLVSGKVTYGSTMTVRYYVTNGAVIRKEGTTERTIADATGAFTLSFCKEASGAFRSRVYFDQRLRSGTNRKLRRQVDVLCTQRSQLQS